MLVVLQCTGKCMAYLPLAAGLPPLAPLLVTSQLEVVGGAPQALAVQLLGDTPVVDTWGQAAAGCNSIQSPHLKCWHTQLG
jgi:hypothetical protein